MYHVKLAKSKEEIEVIIQLRYQILRKPWNQPMETATDNLEFAAINAFIEDESGKVIACGRLQENENKVGQIRFMAVDQSYQGQGLGKYIVLGLEEQANILKLKKIELQARENAIHFYKACNYTVKEKTFLLWDQIQHYLMEKVL
jgi:N-acetylglutamate synthase-like GNAT family acetyltransferase